MQAFPGLHGNGRRNDFDISRKRYGFSSIGYNFLLATFVLEYSLLVRGWFTSIEEKSSGHFEISLPK